MIFDSHTIFDIVSAAVTVGWFVVGLAIRNALGGIRLAQAADKADLIRTQGEVKSDLIYSQNSVKEELNAKHAENKQDIAVHVAEDEQRFNAIRETLGRIEVKIDRNTPRRTT